MFASKMLQSRALLYDKAHLRNVMGWEYLIVELLNYIGQHCQNVVLMRWGKAPNEIDEHEDNHLNLENFKALPKAWHPVAHHGKEGIRLYIPHDKANQPHCNHFRDCNKFLKKKGLDKINWRKAFADPQQTNN